MFQIKLTIHGTWNIGWGIMQRRVPGLREKWALIGGDSKHGIVFDYRIWFKCWWWMSEARMSKCVVWDHNMGTRKLFLMIGHYRISVCIGKPCCLQRFDIFFECARRWGAWVVVIVHLWADVWNSDSWTRRGPISLWTYSLRLMRWKGLESQHPLNLMEGVIGLWSSIWNGSYLFLWESGCVVNWVLVQIHESSIWKVDMMTTHASMRFNNHGSCDVADRRAMCGDPWNERSFCQFIVVYRSCRGNEKWQVVEGLWCCKGKYGYVMKVTGKLSAYMLVRR